MDEMVSDMIATATASSSWGRADLDAMTATLTRTLTRTVSLGAGGTFRALSETAGRFDETAWFWTDDNAKAAELLAEPATYDRDPAGADAAIDFVVRMSRGLVMRRRCGPAELRVVRRAATAFRIETSFFILDGDLMAGVVRHSLRFNDNRSIAAARHGAGSLAFRHMGRRVVVQLADTISEASVDVGADAATLGIVSTLRHRGPVLGHVTCRYTIDRHRPSVALAVTLRVEPGIVLEDVVLSTALEGLGSVPRVHYRALGIRTGDRRRVARPAPGEAAVLHRGPADDVAIVQEGGAPGFAYGLHGLLVDGNRLEAITGASKRGDRFDAVSHRYRLGTVSGEATIREERLLTGGGYYDVPGHYADVMRLRGEGGAVDPSMSYDIGAELNAVAAHLLFARRGRYARPPPPERLEALTAWYDRHLGQFFAHVRAGAEGDLGRVYTRGLAFVALSLDCMVRATGQPRYRALMDVAVGLILRLARRQLFGPSRHGTTFADVWAPRGCFLDCHAACLLALARASRHGDPTGALAPAIAAGLRNIHLYQGVVKLSPTHSEPYDGLAVIQRRRWDTHVDTGFWTFKVGLVLRALHAVRRAADAGALPLSDAARRALDVRVSVAERQIAASCRRVGDRIEVMTSPVATETNSETQPWVALGLVPAVDEAIEGCHPPPALSTA